jgi:NTP pyrophosphatase (non-canonical NTP hydrolase)
MTRREYRKSIVTIAEHYGLFSQSLKLVEELSELQKAVIKYISADVRKPGDKESIIEEMADVEIMLEQIKYLFVCNNEVEEVKELKILRQLERIAKGK